MLHNAKQRARREGLPFDLTEADIVIPARCPVLGIPLRSHIGEGKGPRPDSPTLDKLIPELGYVPGNIVVVSAEANRLKDRLTPVQMIDVGHRFLWLQERALKLQEIHGKDRPAFGYCPAVSAR